MKFPTYECHTFDEEGCFCVYGRSQTVKQQNQFQVKKHNLKKKKENEEAQHFTGTFSAGTRAHAWKPEGKMTG